jgi:putative ATP-dependent endonuclease of OLD family
MYLEALSLRNFRKYGSVEDGPGLVVHFSPGVNLLVGENDSGKSCVIDAIHHVLFDESYGWVRVFEEDFHADSTQLSIECIFRGFSDEEAKNFVEWLSIDDEGDLSLRLVLQAERRGNRIFTDVRAGSDEEGAPLTKEARQYLCATYLRPLRDAERDLSAGRRSRLAQILGSHPAMTGGSPDSHELTRIVQSANDKIRAYFGETGDGYPVSQRLLATLESLRREGSDLSPTIDLSAPCLKSILEKLALNFSRDNRYPGLGSQNLLYIAAELLLLREESEGLRLALIEEIEAHLDPQAQLRVMQFFEKESTGIQLIIGTHSPNLASSIDLKGLTIFRDTKAFPMGPAHTALSEDDYGFLRRFLDATKANLFFASGVIVVEGAAENILMPILAHILTGNTLAKYGVSVVNVGGTALLRYARIFHRRDGGAMGFPVACISDRDIPPVVAKAKGLITTTRKTEADLPAVEIAERIAKHRAKIVSSSPDVRYFTSPCWTLEFDLACGRLAAWVHAAVKLAQAVDERIEPLPSEDKGSLVQAAFDEVSTWLETLCPDEVACLIYAPLASKAASKAATAEQLAQLLLDSYTRDPEQIRTILLEDESCAYLREAIEYVTSGGHRGDD